MDTILYSEEGPWHREPYHMKIKVPPMATVILKVDKIYELKNKNTKIEEVELKEKDNINSIEEVENKTYIKNINDTVEKEDERR
ncbi:hypothetical protein CLMAG_55350 [Clostridium magnum DSM 2767]|uniref:Uncharacterized protein n=3 Tax=Clostridium magnum TaxID=33954 RepID=A0A161W1K2_9CLOT|nr:hypothetical protein CLMAG_55350 [Clostridium magnum DSM 2767]